MLSATMGYITRDVRAEIANGRLAMMDVIGMYFQKTMSWRDRGANRALTSLTTIVFLFSYMNFYIMETSLYRQSLI